MNYDALEIPRRNGLRVRSGLLSFETMDWLSLSWAQEVPARCESQTRVVGPRIIIKPERHPPDQRTIRKRMGFEEVALVYFP